MKRWLILLAALLVFTGCAAEPEDTAPPTTIAATEAAETQAPTEPEIPAVLYDPNSTMEIATGGTVRAYPLNRSDSIGMFPMGDGLLLLSGTENTTLTKLTGDTLAVEETTGLECTVDPGSPALQVSERQVTYYDEAHRELVTLDDTLREVRRTAMPDSIVGSPALSADGKTLYYCTAHSLRSIDLEAGLDKLLKEMSHNCQTLTGLHCADTVLACSAADSRGSTLTLYISAQTGETLYQLSEDILLWTADQNYFAVHYDGAYPELITGSAENEAQLLDHPEAFDTAVPNADLTSVVLAGSDPKENTGRLDCYDPKSGTRTASVTIPGSDPIRCIRSDDTYIWFLRYDSSYGCDVLCRWDPRENPVADATAHLAQRYDARNPDLEGLDRCARTAASLSEQYGVEVLIWNDAAAYEPDEITLTAEYQVPLIEPGLERLDAALSRYPEGFLEKAAAGTDSGMLKICLVRSIGAGETCLQYWTGDSACIALCPDENLEQNFHHQMFYILENRVLSTCSAYDSWNSLNPAGFSYTLDQEAEIDDRWLQGDSRAFIDRDAMSFPRVDRARIMEYAMMSGNKAYFESETMQNKLRRLCQGIRDAFDLEDSEESFRWEQYLNE